MKNPEIKKFLESVGLDETGQKVYFALMGLADAPVSLIAQKAKIKRTTCYTALANLGELGLASSYTSQGIKRYAAESINNIKATLEERLSTFDRLKGELGEYSKHSRHIPQVSFYEGEQGIRSIYNKTLENEEGVLYSVGSSKKIKEALGPDFTFSRRRVGKKILSKSLRVHEEELGERYIREQKQKLREIRLLPQGMTLPSSFLIWDNNVAVISSKEEFGFLVHSENFAKSMKSVFDELWKISRPT